MSAEQTHRGCHWAGSAAAALPDDGRGVLIGRVWDPAQAGPSPVLVRDGEVYDLSRTFATVRDVTESPDPAGAAREAAGPRLAAFGEVHGAAQDGARDLETPRLLAPHDLHAVKAAGVTFAASMIERVIEERAAGDAMAAAEIRRTIAADVGGDLRGVRPGSARADDLKQALIGAGLWSQYLEVGIGPDAEIFTKTAPLASVGTGAEIGVLASSIWNNSEPEMVVVVNSRGVIVGATLGNDVNLRDVEGRSALLLGKAKDNTSSSATGPLIRLFDETFGIDDVRAARISLTVVGDDGYRLTAASDMSEISRDPLELVAQLLGPHHAYPDGAVLFLGTLFAPDDDRFGTGNGFSHVVGDIVTIATPTIGALVNRVQFSERCEPWTFGMSDLMKNLAARGLLAR